MYLIYMFCQMILLGISHNGFKGNQGLDVLFMDNRK